jgi:hypothetical protein
VCLAFIDGKTIGYWKNHTGLDAPTRDSTYDQLPVFLGIFPANGLPEMSIASEDDARGVFVAANSSGDGVEMLTAQLLASKLNALKYNGYAEAYLPDGQKVGDVMAHADAILDDLANGIDYDKDTIVLVKSLLDLANNNGEGSQALQTCTFPPTPDVGTPSTTPTPGSTAPSSPSPTNSGAPGDCGADRDDDDNDNDGVPDEDDVDDDNDGVEDIDDFDDDNDGLYDFEDGDDDGRFSNSDNDGDGTADKDDDDDDDDGQTDWNDEDDDNDGKHDWEDGDDDNSCRDNDNDNDGLDDDQDNDDDNDGYKDEDESNYIGTNAKNRCGAQGWPSDLYTGGASYNTLTVQDLLSFVAPVRRLQTDPGDPAFDPRWDLLPGPQFGSTISIQDLTSLIAGPTAYPPMFNGQRAFGRTCKP